LRASDLAAGLRHLELRAGYAGGTGVLIVAGPDGSALRIEIDCGSIVSRTELKPRAHPVLESSVRIDLRERALTHYTATGSERRLHATRPR